MERLSGSGGGLIGEALSETRLTRYTQPEPELKLLLDQLKLTLPAQSPPKISAVELAAATPHVVKTY
jgi:hypothetical protein